MRVVGVVDLRGGVAVHARQGNRDRYLPVSAAAGLDFAPGDAAALARVYRETLGLVELYVADLDAIAGLSWQEDALALVTCHAAQPRAAAESTGETDARDSNAVPERAADVWLDAGIADASAATRAVAAGVSHVVVALETLTSFERLHEIRDAVKGAEVVFSLDLRDGQPMSASGSAIADAMLVESIAERAVASGATQVVVLDVARVGSDRGVDVSLLRRVRDAVGDVPLLCGGGIRGVEDLRAAGDAGCDGALVATALLDGRITRDDVRRATRWTRWLR